MPQVSIISAPLFADRAFRAAGHFRRACQAVS
jgi:hypothetical protein